MMKTDYVTWMNYSFVILIRITFISAQCDLKGKCWILFSKMPLSDFAIYIICNLLHTFIRMILSVILPLQMVKSLRLIVSFVWLYIRVFIAASWHNSLENMYFYNHKYNPKVALSNLTKKGAYDINEFLSVAYYAFYWWSATICTPIKFGKSLSIFLIRDHNQ